MFDAPLEKTATGLAFSPPTAEVLYPGEVATFECVIDEDAGVVHCTVYVQCAPGLFMWLRRVQYRLVGSRRQLLSE